jgi:hypothetical protein
VSVAGTCSLTREISATRPVLRRISAGFGNLGRSATKVYRVDAGPRLTVKVRPNVKPMPIGGSGLPAMLARVPAPP